MDTAHMQKNRSAKLVLSLVLGVLSILGISSFAADPSFSITPSSGTQLKLHCKYNFWILINPGGQTYNGFDSTLKFDSSSIAILHQSINPFFTSTTNGFISSGFLYRSYWVKPGGSWSSVLTAANFLFSTTQNILSTYLEFTTITWWMIVFDMNTTDDGAVINSSISSLDILTWTTNAGYAFSPLPCIIDNEAPLMMGLYPANNARYISTGQIISFVLYDRAWPWTAAGVSPMTNTNNRSHYRYSGLDTSNLNNYQSAPSSVDNQEWVYSWSIKVTIACPNCTWWWRTYTLNPANLNISQRTGNNSINRYTRDSENRWYAVNFASPAPFGYEVEKQITMTIVWSDNPNELGTIHTGNFTAAFNSPLAPTISMTSPIDWATFVDSKISPITFTFIDDRAGIDTWSINISIPAIYSWVDLLYTWKTYSWTDLAITLISGQPWLWNSWSYSVSLVPQRHFPSNAEILITWSVKDLASNTSNASWQFTTRPSCSFWWCTDTFGLNIFWGSYAWTYSFSGGIIIVTWTNINSPYPYLTWTNNDILMCGRPYTWTILQWNIWIYDTNGISINGTLYTWDGLYITWMDGLDFIYTNGTIIVQ